MEQHIMASSPELSGALVIGAQRFQAALLIEPATDKNLTTAEQASLIERVWSSVEEANISAPAHARVEKAFILVVSADRRLIRSGKGTFIRGASISQYSEEIENLYSSEDGSGSFAKIGDGEAVLYASGRIEATRLIRHQVRTITGLTSFGEAENLLDRGMDSLQGLQLTRALRRTFCREDIALSTIYQNPSVAGLTSVIVAHNNRTSESDHAIMENLLALYAGLISKIPVDISSAKRSRGTEPVDVLVTGSTGAVGTQLVHSLLTRDGIGRIFCLNRGDDGGCAAQYNAFDSAGLSTSEFKSRVTFIKADLQHPSLGLDDATTDSLQSQVALVIHAAWPVNFNMPLVAFRPQLAGIVNLMAWTAKSTSATKFVFISSIAAVEGNHFDAAPERICSDLGAAAPFGYGQAKLLAELLVDKAARHLEKTMTACVVRVGQVAGPVHRRGLWNPKEWLPSMVMSSLHLGQIPNTLGPRFDLVDFVPIDVLADVLVEIAMAPSDMVTEEFRGTDESAAAVFNIRNPHLTAWVTLLPAIVERPGEQKPLQVVTPSTWLGNLQRSTENDDEDTIARKNPAVKLLGFFEKLWPAKTGRPEDSRATGLPQPMMIKKSLACSATLQRMEPVSLEWMRKWVQEWVDFQAC